MIDLKQLKKQVEQELDVIEWEKQHQEYFYPKENYYHIMLDCINHLLSNK